MYTTYICVCIICKQKLYLPTPRLRRNGLEQVVCPIPRLLERSFCDVHCEPHQGRPPWQHVRSDPVQCALVFVCDPFPRPVKHR